MDRVRPLKLEDTQDGGGHLDFGPTELNPKQDAVDVAGVYLQESTTSDTTVLIDRNQGQARFADPVAGTQLLSALAQHPVTQGPIRNSYLQIVGPAFAPTQEIWWTDSTMAKRIQVVTYTQTAPATAFTPSPVTTQFYAANGTTVVCQIVDTIAYNGQAVATISRAVTYF